MSIFDKARGEFVDIIEWTDSSTDTMVYRFPRYMNEIKYGAKLTVRASQEAVFVNEGQMADTFVPGLYTLETQNMPILTTLKGWKYGFASPFKAEVYFINTKQFTNQKWGTKNPILLRDAEFGPIRIRAFGNFAIRVKDSKKFLTDIVGTNASYTTDEIVEQLRNIVITRFSDKIGESKIPVLDMASNYDQLSSFIADKINPEFEELGIELTKFLIENVSLPEEVEAELDKRSSMGILGNMNTYTQFQAANSIETAAANPGGIASAGVGLGMGLGMGNQMSQAFQNAQQGQQNQNDGAGAPPPIPASAYYVATNGQQTGPFNENTLGMMVQMGALKKDTLIWKQGMAAWVAASQVAELSSLFEAVPPPLPG